MNKKLNFNGPNECIHKKFQESNKWASFGHKHKRNNYVFFFLASNC